MEATEGGSDERNTGSRCSCRGLPLDSCGCVLGVCVCVCVCVERGLVSGGVVQEGVGCGAEGFRRLTYHGGEGPHLLTEPQRELLFKCGAKKIKDDRQRGVSAALPSFQHRATPSHELNTYPPNTHTHTHTHIHIHPHSHTHPHPPTHQGLDAPRSRPSASCRW
jgi:hypothetical protein